jgi:RNA polymerase sigma-32 factor
MRLRAGLPKSTPRALPLGSLMRPRRARPVDASRETERADDSLDPTEEIHLCRRWRASQDQAALRALVSAHLGLVQRIANEFRHAGPEREDLVQEGHVGLVIAARRFDPSKSARLATYASYWIRACMMELVVRTHGAVRLGTTRAQRRIFFGLGRARRELERGGEAASSEALAAQLGVETAELEEMAARLGNRDLSLDAPRYDEGQPLGATLTCSRPDPEHTVAGHEEREANRRRLRDALDALTPREREIIEARHLAEDPPTLAELGEKLGVSRERVRQLEERAFARLRQRMLH